MPTLGHAQHIEQLYDENTYLNLSSSLFYLQESDLALTINEVTKHRHEFRRHTDENPNFGFRSEGVWLLTSLSNVSTLEHWVASINFSQLDKVDFYIVKEGEVLAQSHQGKTQREQIFRIPTFRVQLPNTDKVDLFIRIESQSSSLIAPLKIQPEPMHSKAVQIDSSMWGLFYGGLFILALYNLVLFFGVKERSLIAYVAYIFAVMLWQFVWGGHIQLLFSNGLPPLIASHTELIFVLIGLCSGLFTLNFLDTKNNAKTAHVPILALLWLQTIIGLVCFFGILPPIWKNNLVYGVGVLAICSYICAGFEAFFNHFKPARYFIFAWSILAAGAIIGMLSLVGILPSNDFTTYCFQVGVFLESGLFSLALMEKSRSKLEQEVEQATNDLRNNMELIEEQNVRLDIARKDAIKASNVKSQFLANMSHEIRTPLNAILGFSRELSKAALPADQQEQARIIDTSADNLLTIVNDVLDFSKIEAGKLQINNQPFSPNNLLEEMVTIMAKSAHSKKLEFVFELGPLPEKLIGDVFRIRQILNNLLSNALKFTSSGSITLSVLGRALPHGIHEVEIVVEDTGIGISRYDRKKLFSAFSQVDDALNRNYQGTGLGLVITRELVRLMRGNLTLKSTPSQGSTFTVTLRNNHLSQKFSLVPNADWQDKKVTLFDPVPATRRASAAMLCRLGASVTSIESLDCLAMQRGKADLLMATLPAYKVEEREAYLTQLMKFPAEKRVLWYSGPEPFAQYPSLNQYFYSQIRMPMTVTKLENVVNAKKLVARNPLQDKVNALPKVRILAVDDMEMNLKLLHTWLEGSPITLVSTTEGRDAVTQCQTQEFDLILMDIQMPGMDGLQASRAIRKTTLNLGTPIIAVTAHAFKEEQERLLASGMDDYLPKPIEINALINIIHSWCHTTEPQHIELPSMDWQLALNRANQNHVAANELMRDFIDLLGSMIPTLQTLWSERDYLELKSEIHKLNGVCCYIGVPRLQSLTDEIETTLKLEQYSHVEEQFPQLLLELEKIATNGESFLQQKN